MLREFEFRNVYTRDDCPDLIGQFFIPALKSASRYDRTTFTFNARSLAAAASGVAGLVNGGGTMRLICNHELEQDVFEAIRAGINSAESAFLDSFSGFTLGEIKPQEIADLGHLKLLTWLVKTNRLKIKIAIRRGGIFHRKIGIFTDQRGDRVSFTGSLNESKAGWITNDECIDVFRSWNEWDDERVASHQQQFEFLWEGHSDHTIVSDIPEAIKQDLIRIAPRNPDELDAAVNESLSRGIASNPATKPLWQDIHHVVAHDPQSTLETIPAELWPHQLSFWRRYARDAQEPPRVLIADEVGLGKTIQAGALLKTFINRGQADRVLILVPAVARWQWQQELRHKFNIDIPVLDRRGSMLRLVYEDGHAIDATPLPWRQVDRLILSYDWMRRHTERFVADDLRYDFIFFDEAHHARYSEVTNPSRRRPNTYLRMLGSLSNLTRGLVLLTATPMQIDPVELWALIQLLDRHGNWTEEEFRRFHDPNLPATYESWNWARKLYLRGGFVSTPDQISDLARIPLNEIRRHLQLIQSPLESPIPKRRLDSAQIKSSLQLMRRTSSIKRCVSRHTRYLLKHYAASGQISQTVPERIVKSVAIEMNREERALYERIRRFVRNCYAESGRMNRQALGFVMTFYRLRLGSSNHAFGKSLRNLRDKLRVNDLEEPEWEEIYHSDLDSFVISNPEIDAPLPLVESSVESEIDSMLQLVGQLGDRDSKFESLIEQINELRAIGYEKIMVFSQFWDTQDWLRGQLARQNQFQFLGGLSGTQNWILDGDGHYRESNRIEIIGKFRESEEGILLCTDSAAESLNFQFCSAIVNYDIPWNPMRLEQRIGRIDRIGQVKPAIRIVHLFYRDSVEFDAYSAMRLRIESFERNVGALQPILDANLERIIQDGIMENASSDEIEQRIEELETAISFDLDDLASSAIDEQDPNPRLRMWDLERILQHPDLFPAGYSIQSSGIGHWSVKAPGYATSVTVTTDRGRHDYAAGGVDFFGPGCRVFPISRFEEMESTNSDTEICQISHSIDSALDKIPTTIKLRRSPI